MTAIKAKAFAKLNLTLEVLGKRNDGFHEISSIMQTISLADHIEVTAARELSLECDLPSLNNNENLAIRAASLLRERLEIRDGAHIRISKEIPLAAGLGGGSSDAVAVLKLLRRLWAVELTDTDLLKMVAEIGSDLPF
jgi:4-diphosphocytidyl-2-C-methyl-D-erythritol kinase